MSGDAAFWKFRLAHEGMNLRDIFLELILNQLHYSAT